MGVLQNLAQANAGVTALATARTAKAVEGRPSSEAMAILHQQEMLRLDTLIAQNDRIIELLVENLGYLARQKAHEVQQASKQ
jgi:hypothetical protein